MGLSRLLGLNGWIPKLAVGSGSKFVFVEQNHLVLCLMESATPYASYAKRCTRHRVAGIIANCNATLRRRIELERVAADRHQGTSSPPGGIGSTVSGAVPRPAPASTPAPADRGGGADDR